MSFAFSLFLKFLPFNYFYPFFSLASAFAALFVCCLGRVWMISILVCFSAFLHSLKFPKTEDPLMAKRRFRGVVRRYQNKQSYFDQEGQSFGGDLSLEFLHVGGDAVCKFHERNINGSKVRGRISPHFWQKWCVCGGSGLVSGFFDEGKRSFWTRTA